MSAGEIATLVGDIAATKAAVAILRDRVQALELRELHRNPMPHLARLQQGDVVRVIQGGMLAGYLGAVRSVIPVADQRVDVLLFWKPPGNLVHERLEGPSYLFELVHPAGVQR
jgi:hypothetical protein